MIKGVQVDPVFYEKGLVQANYFIGEGTFGNLNFILPYKTYVSCPYQEAFCQDSDYKLTLKGNQAYLVWGKNQTVITLLKTANFDCEKKVGAFKIGDLAISYGSYISLKLGGHRYMASHLESTDSNQKNSQSKSTNPIPDVKTIIEALRTIGKTQKIDVVSLSCWDGTQEDGGISQIAEYIKAIKKYFHVLLLIEVHLPKNKNCIDYTYALGADSVCYHLGDLCVHGNFDQRPDKRDPHEELSFLDYAVKTYPKGSVLSHITINEREFTDVVEDIGRLSKTKVLPVLTFENLAKIQSLGYQTEQLAPLFGYVYHAAKQNKIPISWLTQLAPFLTPFEGHFFAGEIPRFKLALIRFYRSRLFGGSISANLSNLRRKIRVRKK